MTGFTRTLFGSKLATRIFVLFLAGAFIPALAVAWLVHEGSETAILEHLEHDLSEWANLHSKLVSLHAGEFANLISNAHGPQSLNASAHSNHPAVSQPLPLGITMHWGMANTSVGHGERIEQLELDEKQRDDLDKGLILVHAIPNEELYILKLGHTAEGGRPLLVARIYPKSLLPGFLPARMERCLLVGNVPVLCSGALGEAVDRALHEAASPGKTLHAALTAGKSRYTVERVVSLPMAFSSARWTILLTTAHPGISQLAANKGSTLILGATLALLVALLLRFWHIRRTLYPLKAMLDATANATTHDFSQSVKADASGELSELSRSFNAMGHRIGRQFKVLKLLAELDRLILSGADIDQLANVLLARLSEVLRLDAAAIVICEPKTGRISRTYFVIYGNEKGVHAVRTGSTSQAPTGPLTDFGDLRHRITELGLIKSIETGFDALALPVKTEDGLSGALYAARSIARPRDEAEDLGIADIADRLGVAVTAMQKDQQLFLQTRFDPLTRLPNRVLFTDRLVQEIARAARSGNMLALLYIDLDLFKQVNDTLGHEAGDQVLRGVAARLRACVRDADTVARLSGDEFSIILSALTDSKDAGILANNIIQRLTEPFAIGPHQSFLGASIGITLYPTDANSPESLIRNADIAMYRAKEAGKGHHVYFDERMNQEAQNLPNLDRELRIALESNQFVLHFQPQLDLKSGAVSGVEALVRWEHPTRGTLAPAYFMSHAESSGLIEPLGELILVKACEHYQLWIMAGIAPPRISINASPRQFKRADFFKFVKATLMDAGMPPGALEIEITETVLMEESDLPRTTINRLAELGVRIAIDDFGTGYSSLSYLKRLPFHLLKIDRSFILDVNNDEDARTITATIIAMPHSLRKEVVAEGVDHVDQLRFLRNELCGHVQGFLFSPPLPDHEFMSFMHAHKAARHGTGEARTGYTEF
ncbi:MAG: EAL domain-containing protein [Betaproteobacteria bacterium]|nr:EAL domain-containing protein [Betaproteobacteria bacterium]